MKQECPDFCLDFLTGSVGVEIVEAIPQIAARAISIANEEEMRGQPVPTTLSLYHLTPEDNLKKRPQVLERIDSTKAPGWTGVASDDLWVSEMCRAILKKCKLASTYSFKPPLHLLIQDEAAQGVSFERAWVSLWNTDGLIERSAKAFSGIHILRQGRTHSRYFPRSANS
ncbi:hypothetical protein [Paracoccus hibiscisoli]|uniref:Uncharacterized protein n=1 Tax=Paracoccus hibiscisoli TaxID=2023261 RepID=A0A4U0QM85_9RHOB|nr:hypothetical protein [Paracoccus hibiscisoli]TJZ82855.1 hypothetical protein FA740_13700 [Paracoccus hibiscisoli]